MFPSNASTTWHSLPSTGSFWGKFPCFRGTMECSELLRPSRRPSLPSGHATMRCACDFAPGGPGRQAAGQGFVVRSPLPERNAWRRSGTPRFLGNPPVSLPCSATPAGPIRQALRRCRCCPRYEYGEGSHEDGFGAESHGFDTRCLRFAGTVTCHDARRASRCWPLCEAGLVTRRIPPKGFRVASYISSPFPRLGLAQIRLTF